MSSSTRITFKRLLFAATILATPLIMVRPMPAEAQIGIGIAIQIAPPLLPVYVQPAMPELGYIWTPGYWAYGDVGYYWVPGTWILPPVVGVLWTPPYWGWANGGYLFHDGYWGQSVGYYGGVNYGYGYGGDGYQGGRWNNGSFAYNRSANNFGSVHASNTYEQPVTGSNHTNVSYAGGTGGLRSEPTAADRQAEHEQHTPATSLQTAHITASAHDPALAATHNNGHPTVAATSRPIAAASVSGTQARPAGATVPATEHTGATQPNGRPTEATAAHPATTAERPAATAEHPAAAAARPNTAAERPATAAERPATTAEHPAVTGARPATAAARPATAAEHPAAAEHAPVPHAAAALAARPTAHAAAPRPAPAHAAASRPAPQRAAARPAAAPRPAAAHAAPAAQHEQKRT